MANMAKKCSKSQNSAQKVLKLCQEYDFYPVAKVATVKSMLWGIYV
jgi:hypothetical protein